MYKLIFYVPPTHLATVKQTLFAAGAGRSGLYDHCCWQTLGTGQFRPLPGSRPFIGEIGRLRQVEEYKVEMLCEQQYLPAALAALLHSHPYEEPAYEILPLCDPNLFRLDKVEAESKLG